MKKNSKVSISYIFTIFFLLFQSCSNRDPFYSHGSGFDYLRFPLIKPYYALTLTHGEPNWNILLEFKSPLRDESLVNAITGIQQIAVSNNIIFVYSPLGTRNDPFNLKEKDFHYFILNLNDNTEMAFEREDEFLEYLGNNKNINLQWLDPLTILQKYDQTGCLNWIPGC
jgi:hypothetical protein